MIIMYISQEYKDRINEAIKDQNKSLIPNCDVGHAFYLIEQIIKTTKKNGKIKIFTNSLYKDIYDNIEILKAIDNAQKRKVSFEIILENPKKEDKIICKKYNLKIYKLLRPAKYPDYKFSYFIISDNIRLRIEKPRDNDAFNKNRIEADCNFNEEKLLNTLIDLFDNTLMINSEKIKI